MPPREPPREPLNHPKSHQKSQKKSHQKAKRASKEPFSELPVLPRAEGKFLGACSCSSPMQLRAAQDVV